MGTQDEQVSDLAALAKLALKAGGRPISWGSYNDEHYKWVASLDRTPGFWTGGISFLLTGGDWKEALAHLENESLPDRTFATARALADVLARRAPKHPDLPALRVAIMEIHGQRGEGQAALNLLPLVELATPTPASAVIDNARRVALLAARQVQVSLTEEVRLYKDRLKHFSADSRSLRPRVKSHGRIRGGESAKPTALPMKMAQATTTTMATLALGAARLPGACRHIAVLKRPSPAWMTRTKPRHLLGLIPARWIACRTRKSSG